MASASLLQGRLSSSVYSQSMSTSRLTRQAPWTQSRSFSNSLPCHAPREPLRSQPAPIKPTWASRVQTPPPPPPAPSLKPSLSPSTAQSTTMTAAPTYDAGSSTFDISKIIAMESDEFLRRHYPTLRKEPELRTKPTLGRTVHVRGKVDMARALRKLAISIKENKVKTMAATQRFHERAGLKRKRLKMDRWRVRFKTGFTAAVGRVLALKRQGW